MQMTAVCRQRKDKRKEAICNAISACTPKSRNTTKKSKIEGRRCAMQFQNSRKTLVSPWIRMDIPLSELLPRGNEACTLDHPIPTVLLLQCCVQSVARAMRELDRKLCQTSRATPQEASRRG